MREIKFRAWDKNSKKIIYGRLVGAFFDASPNPDFSEHEWDGTPLEEMNLEPWKQYTGLKDKNGKEVYQGDILKVKADKEGYGSCSYGGIVEVMADTCGYSLKPINPTFKEMEERGEAWDSSSMWHVCEGDTTEVIGNIYENPELLVKSSK